MGCMKICLLGAFAKHFCNLRFVLDQEVAFRDRQHIASYSVGRHLMGGGGAPRPTGLKVLNSGGNLIETRCMGEKGLF